MTRGYWMELKRQPSSGDELVFAVIADGWNGRGEGDRRVGILRVTADGSVASFVPEGAWIEDNIAYAFDRRSTSEIPEGEGVWVKWLLQLARLAPTKSKLTRFV
jgi:hypothetical protein